MKSFVKKYFYLLVGVVLFLVVLGTFGGSPDLMDRCFGPDTSSPEYLFSRLENSIVQNRAMLEKSLLKLQHRVERLEKLHGVSHTYTVSDVAPDNPPGPDTTTIDTPGN